jgi:hypothetical protein
MNIVLMCFNSVNKHCPCSNFIILCTTLRNIQKTMICPLQSSYKQVLTIKKKSEYTPNRGKCIMWECLQRVLLQFNTNYSYINFPSFFLFCHFYHTATCKINLFQELPSDETKQMLSPATDTHSTMNMIHVSKGMLCKPPI